MERMTSRGPTAGAGAAGCGEVDGEAGCVTGGAGVAAPPAITTPESDSREIRMSVRGVDVGEATSSVPREAGCARRFVLNFQQNVVTEPANEPLRKFAPKQEAHSESVSRRRTARSAPVGREVRLSPEEGHQSTAAKQGTASDHSAMHRFLRNSSCQVSLPLTRFLTEHEFPARFASGPRQSLPTGEGSARGAAVGARVRAFPSTVLGALSSRATTERRTRRFRDTDPHRVARRHGAHRLARPHHPDGGGAGAKRCHGSRGAGGGPVGAVALDRARAGRGHGVQVPRAVMHRPAGGGRLLLRHLPRRPRGGGGGPGGSGEAGAEHPQRQEPHFRTHGTDQGGGARDVRLQRLQVRDHRQAQRARHHHRVPRRTVYRLVPRAARARLRSHQSGEDHQDRPGVLAGPRRPAVLATGIWHLVSGQAAAERVAEADGRGSAPGSADADGVRLCAVGGQRPRGQLPREHVQLRVGAARVWHEADELSVALPHVCAPQALASRVAAAPGRFRRAASQRTQWHAQRSDARAQVRAGRRAHLLHARTGGVGGVALSGVSQARLRCVRFPVRVGAVHPAGKVHGRCGVMGARRGHAGDGAGDVHRQASRRTRRLAVEPGRRGLLRTQDRRPSV
eukprot:ctg_3238.g652